MIKNTDEVDSKTMTMDNLELLLEQEKQNNKKEQWVKLDKTIKTQKLHSFAERYGKEQGMNNKMIKQLKIFFNTCLDKNKLNKTRDINYNKDEMEVISVPALFFNKTTHNFTLKITDPKRVSTVKSLTPKRNKKIVVEEDELQENEKISAETIEKEKEKED